MFQDEPTVFFSKGCFRKLLFWITRTFVPKWYILEFKEVFCLRPNLSKDISIESFKDFYWLKEELQTFCRENGISSTGSKIEISDRIETFLRSGGIKNPIRKTKINRTVEPQVHLSLDTVIRANHRCSQDVRAVFKTAIPKFHFQHIQNYFKSNAGKTYRNVVDA